MFTFVLQLRDTLLHGNFYLFTAFFALVWVLWFWKLALSAFYKPYTGTYEGTTSVVIPVVDEPLDLFTTVLERIVEQGPDEVLVVINGARNVGLENACASVPGVQYHWTKTPGKRNAVREGVEKTTGDIVLLVDSDTLWTSDTLVELVKPFADERVGGVTTRQKIIAPERNILTRWADWLESLRAEYAQPAQSVLGTIGCLPGRTIAFRRVVLENCMVAFMTEKFMGVFLEVSDDRTLTNYALKQGYRTVYQSTALVYTDAPTNIRILAKQQLRWARGSQYNTFRMMPWMVRNARTLAVFFAADIISPFLLLGVITGWMYRLAIGDHVDLYSGMLGHYGYALGIAQIVVLTILGSVVSFALRQSRHLRSAPGDLLRLPIYIVLCTLMLMPIRMYGFLRMAHAGGWGTRKDAYKGERKTVMNPLASIPYVMAFALMTMETLYRG